MDINREPVELQMTKDMMSKRRAVQNESKAKAKAKMTAKAPGKTETGTTTTQTGKEGEPNWDVLAKHIRK